MGNVTVRIMGSKDDIETIVKELQKIFRKVWTSGPYQNTRDPGWRVYVNITLQSDAQ